jgi:hypothetical protein
VSVSSAEAGFLVRVELCPDRALPRLAVPCASVSRARKVKAEPCPDLNFAVPSFDFCGGDVVAAAAVYSACRATREFCL